jgi:hypothetical protein
MLGVAAEIVALTTLSPTLSLFKTPTSAAVPLSATTFVPL